MSVGIALSGGGARGFAHVGVLKALTEMGIKPSMISGTSSGAVMGAYYAAGFGFQEIIDIVSKAELFRILDFSILKPGLFKTDAVKKSLEKNLSGLTFETLKVPLVVAATDIKNCVTHYFSKGNLVEALVASSAIPAIYQPVEIDDMLLADGAVLNNFPIEPLKDKCTVIIGSHVNPINKSDQHEAHITTILDRTFHLAISNTIELKKQQCTFFIEPPELFRFGMFDMDVAEEIAAIGYNYTMSLRKEIEKVISV